MLAVVAAMAVVTAAEGAPRSSKASILVTRAVAQMVEGQLTGAVDSLARAKRARATAELDALVGLVALAGQRPKLAQAQLDEAIRKGSTQPLVFYWAGRAELALGRRGRALKRIQAALTVAPEDPTFHMAHALLLNGMGKAELAVASLVVVARRRPNVFDPSLFPTPKEGAVLLLGRILSRFPARLQVLRTQGHLLWRARRYTTACRRFKDLLKARPGDADGLQMMARCRMALDSNPRKALQLAGKALERSPGAPQALATRGEILLELGKPKQAIKDLRRAADRLPTDTRLLTRLAQACSDAEQPRCARKFFTYALRREPKSAAAAFGLALHLQQGNDHEATFKAFRRALTLAPGNPRYYRAAASFANTRGQKRLSRRWLREARRAQVLQKRLSQVREGVARTAKRTARVSQLLQKGECSKECRKVINRQPRVARALFQAHVLLKKKQPHTARKLLKTILGHFRVQLLLKDPATYEQKGKLTNGRRYTLRTRFPYLPTWQLIRPRAIKQP